MSNQYSQAEARRSSANVTVGVAGWLLANSRDHRVLACAESVFFQKKDLKEGLTISSRVEQHAPSTVERVTTSPYQPVFCMCVVLHFVVLSPCGTIL